MYVSLLHFVPALSLGIHSLRPHQLPFRGFPFHLSDHQSGKSQWGGSAVQYISLPNGDRALLRPHELEQATKHFWPCAREVIPAPGKKKKKKHNDSEIAALHPFAGLIHTAALTLNLGRSVLFLVQLKISQFTFIMTGADKFAGEMQAVSLLC